MRALITGASRGIGAATAERLARDGFEVVLHYHAYADGARRVAEKISKSGGSAELISGDLGNRNDVEKVARAVVRSDQALDVLVNNAGTYPRERYDQLDPQKFEACFRTNVFGPAELTRRLLPALQQSERGRIIFVSSVLAFTGSRHGAHYAASKAALLGLSRSLARELAPRVTVNAVAPGSIDTAILADDTSEVRAERIRTIPMGRIGTSTDVAAAIAFLASAEASYITGTTVHVNGGLWLG